jgi:hypothetical protein
VPWVLPALVYIQARVPPRVQAEPLLQARYIRFYHNKKDNVVVNSLAVISSNSAIHLAHTSPVGSGSAYFVIKLSGFLIIYR